MLDLTIFRHHSGKGTDKGEKKAGNLVSSHVLWLTWLPVQVSSLRLAAASEAALVGIHVQRQVSRKRLARSSGVGAGPGPGPSGRSGLVGGCPGPRCGLLGDS